MDKDPIDLSRYQISSKTGFLPSGPRPLTVLPGDYFAPWEKVLTCLPDLIKRKVIRREIDGLPELEFSHSTLKTDAEWQRAYLLLSFLGQGYMWMEGDKGVVSVVSSKIAVPWISVSDHLGLLPVGTYASAVLFNYGLRDPDGPMKMENLYSLHTFTGSKDESWFFMVHVLVELATVPALNAMARVFGDMARKDNAAISDCLKVLQKSLSDMQENVNRMYDGCAPKTFFVDIRPYFGGSQDQKLFPDGGAFYGVESNPRRYIGASAAQSSGVYAFDKLIGTVFSGKKESEFVEAVRDYMPKKHREFLVGLGKMPSLRDYCRDSGSSELIAEFNGVVDKLVSFRSNHINLVALYVNSQKKNSKNPSLDDVGTGGTELADFLKNNRGDTEARKIPAPE